MSVIQINKKVAVDNSFALFNLGFRPFFLGAAAYSVISIFYWMLVYVFHFKIETGTFSVTQLHSHEMIYGFSIAVIAGFLLTAVMNWTGIQTLRGKPLAALFSIWALARILMFYGSEFLLYAALSDLVFMTGLMMAVASPIIKSRQYRQLGILSKIIMLTAGNMSFYLGALGYFDNGINIGIYGGLYLVISLILTIGGRVMPMFIRNGIKGDVQITNPGWLAIVIMVLFLIFFVNQLFLGNQSLMGVLSLCLFFLTSFRLYCWYNAGIWKNHMLWCLYLAFVSISLGFFLLGLTLFLPINYFLAIHCFAYGGIGLSTLSMMARVSLGHSGRPLTELAGVNYWSFTSLAAGTFIRIFFPLFSPQYYLQWILISQLLWIFAFSIFLFSYFRILKSPRADGVEG